MLADFPLLREAFRAAGYGPAEWQGEIWVYEMPLEPALAATGLEGEMIQDSLSAASVVENGAQRGSGDQTEARKGPGGVRT